MPKPLIIIAAISSRAYVQAAVNAGYDVIAIDAFNDVDTQKMAKKMLQVPVNNGQFVASMLCNALDSLDALDKVNAVGISIGAGFEAQPALLQALAKRFCMIANTFDVIAQCKNPLAFVNACKRLNMCHPVTQLSRPTSSLGWLKKQIGGSGGTHIKALLPLKQLENNTDYYQQKLMGMPISCLFLADGKNAQVIGFNEQMLNATDFLPYRYGGAVSHIDLPDTVKNIIDAFVQGIVNIFGLKGINSADFLLENNNVYALEINPRLSASLDLYRAKKGDLFTAHVAAFMGNLQDWPTVEKQSRAHNIVYANKLAVVPAIMDWPDWVCDIPQPNSHIASGAPICTVVADARTAKLALQKLRQRVTLL